MILPLADIPRREKAPTKAESPRLTVREVTA